MKSKNLIWLLAVALAPAAQAGTFTLSSGTLNADIPDGDLSGYQSSLTTAGNVTSGSTVNDDSVTAVTVTLNISGGYNGDLYGYLVHTDSHGSTGFTVLLDRIGQTTGGSSDFGSSGSGFSSVTLDDTASVNIHNASYTAGAALTGTYKPDGSTLNVNPSDPNYLSSNGDVGATTLGAMNGLGGDGTWTLFLADVSPGGVSTLVSWSATISAVPEPVTSALGIFGALGLGTVLFRRKK